jgi:transposase
MAGWRLREGEREALIELARKTRDAAVLRRAQALLAVDGGQRPAAVAEELGVDRSTVYDWLKRYGQERCLEPLASRLTDRHRTGRPPNELQRAMGALAALLATSPQSYGYRHNTWTAGLLHRHLTQEQHLVVSPTTVRRAIHALGYRWKRPRYSLSRRAAQWRQAKGGSNAG